MMNDPTRRSRGPRHVPSLSQITPTYVSAQLGASSVFIWHHPEDGAFREALSKHLAMAKRSGRLSTRCQEDIAPGQDREGALREALYEADIVVLLVSSDLLHSNEHYAFLKEAVGYAHTTGARIIPVLVRNCQLDGTPFAHFQPLPRDRRPIGSLDKASQEDAWALIAQELWALVDPVVSSGALAGADPRSGVRRVDPSQLTGVPSSFPAAAPLSQGNTPSSQNPHPSSQNPYPPSQNPYPPSQNLYPQAPAPSSLAGSITVQRPTLPSATWPTPMHGGNPLSSGEGRATNDEPGPATVRVWGKRTAALGVLAALGVALTLFAAVVARSWLDIPDRPTPTPTQVTPTSPAPTRAPGSPSPTPTPSASTPRSLAPLRPGSVNASSKLDVDRPEYAFDGDNRTAWCEGAKSDGRGEWIEATAPAGSVLWGIDVTAGWAYDSPIAGSIRGDGDMWRLSHTVTRARIDHDGGSTFVTFLRSDRGVTKRVTFPSGSSRVRVTIEEIARGEGGNNVCLDGLTLLGN